uniref:Aldehyde dehydrogenase domain-containing protein n=1 Tax=Bionectria ochroleuca TaxID=29856 RepID=A0A8H7K9M3_BIOOC
MSSSFIFCKNVPYTFHDASLLDVRSYVGGEWENSSENKTFAVEDPADQQILANVSDSSVADYERAIDIANTAFKAYRQLTPSNRGQLLRNWAQAVRESSRDLAALCTLELGKPINESIKAVAYAASCLDWFANLADQGCGGETIPSSGNGGRNRIWTVRRPVGVVCAITPWNSPYSGVLKKIAPALAVGCTIVHKPAPETPLCAMALAKTCQRAGFPAGVYNVLASSPGRAAAVGSLFCSHPSVRHVTFTGSTAVGRYLAERCGANLKKITMELGGNAAFIVFDDADLDLAVRELIACKFNSSGQVCIYANRVLVHSGIEKAFTDRLLVAIQERVRLGSPWDDKVTLGPLYAKAGADKIEALRSDALAKGASLHTPDVYEDGSTYYPPTVMTRITQEMRISHEEIFGPLVAISTFDKEEEAVSLANSVDTGLAGYVFTQNISRLFRVAEELQAGMVGAQTGSISAIEQPFGGVRDSGMGREGSIHALEEYTDVKSITLAL